MMNIEAYLQTKRFPGGLLQLFYRGTRNEVFPGMFFASRKAAIQYFWANYDARA